MSIWTPVVCYRRQASRYGIHAAAALYGKKNARQASNRWMFFFTSTLPLLSLSFLMRLCHCNLTINALNMSFVLFYFLRCFSVMLFRCVWLSQQQHSFSPSYTHSLHTHKNKKKSNQLVFCARCVLLVLHFAFAQFLLYCTSCALLFAELDLSSKSINWTICFLTFLSFLLSICLPCAQFSRHFRFLPLLYILDVSILFSFVFCSCFNLSCTKLVEHDSRFIPIIIVLENWRGHNEISARSTSGDTTSVSYQFNSINLRKLLIYIYIDWVFVWEKAFCVTFFWHHISKRRWRRSQLKNYFLFIAFFFSGSEWRISIWHDLWSGTKITSWEPLYLCQASLDMQEMLRFFCMYGCVIVWLRLMLYVSVNGWGIV